MTVDETAGTSVVREDRSRSLLQRLRDHPGPAARWGAVAGLLLVFELGAICSLLGALVPVDVGLAAIGDALPTLLSRETIPNQGANVPGTWTAGPLLGLLPAALVAPLAELSPIASWQGTFLGLPPSHAWALRVALVYAYGTAWIAWIWRGYGVFRREYRRLDWTPRDDVVRRFSSHYWGLFGLSIVLAFVVFAVFAPALGPTTMEANAYTPFSHEVTTFDEASGELRTLTAGAANLESVSQGTEQRNVGPFSYDSVGRYHPFGTLPSGQDLFTAVAAGARVSLFISLLAIAISAVISVTLALASAYYGGLFDLVVVLLGDATQSLPQLLVVILLSVVLSETWIASLYSGGVLLAIIFALTGWPSLWRVIRGPALQVAEQEWVEAADGFGTGTATTMRKHMLPYVVGYLFVYASMSLGGIIIGISGLSFLGLGVSPPTPEWGRIVNVGQPFLTTVSWHIAVIPGLCIVVVVTGFNALGDGVRDAIDAETDSGEEETAAAASGAGG